MEDFRQIYFLVKMISKKNTYKKCSLKIKMSFLDLAHLTIQ